MAKGFAALPNAPAYRLVNARAPLALLTASGLAADREGLSAIDLTVEDGRIASVVPAGMATLDAGLPALDLDGGIVLPRLVDIHTHLDKGHIWPRRPNPDGTFLGALQNAGADREARWTAEDVRARMDFALRCAFAHGTGAIRTHLDSIGPQTAISWPVFAETREEWRGRIALQAVSLFPLDLVLDDEAQFRAIVAQTARHGGVLGGVTFLGQAPTERTDRALDRLFQAAAAEGIDVDLHVDESDSPAARTLVRVAEAAIRNRYAGKVLCGHACSLALMSERDLARAIARIAEAKLAVVSLPLCNMYLQDRRPGRTPRWRGVAPLHELQAAGIPVMVASDNTRDPFHAYGDLDMLEVLREATRILHLDHGGPDPFRTVAATPADLMNLDRHGRIEAGDAADLVLTRARGLTELLARPHADRTVLVAGQAIDTTLPDYRELDRWMLG
ncbi:MAG TPA: cytosine deaminase [Microvirga sp.]|jgi:cytosine deaminase|nr:cytosine deaminase [Microvirga sp.]